MSAGSARQLWFAGPGQVEIREQVLPELSSGQLLVRTVRSAISAGTELLAYRDQMPKGLPLDDGIEALKSQNNSFPFQYGYACAGRVEAVGPGVSPDYQNKLVFAFQPHASRFIADAAGVIRLPEGMSAEAGVFTANMETAVNLLQDGAPILGENVVVLGLGVVGQLVLRLLSRFPLAGLYALDVIESRIKLAGQTTGVTALSANSGDGERGAIDALRIAMHDDMSADLVYELSGNPAVLDRAIEVCGFDSRIIVGSWYGDRTAAVNLGGGFHRNRIRISSSQVSTIASGMIGRWTKARRFKTVLDALSATAPAGLISHRLPLERAAEAYRLLDESPEECLQVVLTYED